MKIILFSLKKSSLHGKKLELKTKNKLASKKIETKLRDLLAYAQPMSALNRVSSPLFEIYVARLQIEGLSS